MLRGTVAASLLVGLFAIAGSLVVGRPSVGMSLAAGLAIGSTNGYLMIAALNRRTPFAASAFLRMALLTGAVVIAATLLRGQPWAVALGVAISQLLLTAVGIREGLRR